MYLTSYWLNNIFNDSFTCEIQLNTQYTTLINFMMKYLVFCSMLMLIKRRPPQLTGFFENKYRHEHVMIINLYIVSHNLYDRHLYECILRGFYACLKEACYFTPPLVELIVIVKPASIQIRGMWQMRRDTTMYPQA